jgi:hypothetical protein
LARRYLNQRAFFTPGLQSIEGESVSPRTAVYRLDRLSGKLVPVDIDQVVGAAGGATILGSDKDRVVFYRKPPAELVWATLK